MNRLSTHPRRPFIEPLETRIAPATFSGTGGPSLDITLDHAGETININAGATTYTVTSNFTATDGGNTGGHVTGFGSTSVAIDLAAYAHINIKDSATNTAVTFGGGGVNPYVADFHVVLDDPTANGLAFLGVSNFTSGLTASVTGNITQAAPVTAQSAEGVSLTSTDGVITLTNTGNNFSVVSLATSGANSITFRNSATLTLDHVTTETGNLSITNGAGIGQTLTGRIDVGGTTTLDIVGGAGVSIQLNKANNFFGGPVIITESGGDIGAVNLRNISPTATAPNLTDLTAGDLSDLQLTFDGTGIVFDAATALPLATNANLALTAGGPITQTAPIVVATLTATALGNHGITLTNVANVVTGTVSLNNPDADGGALSAVAYVENAAVNLGASKLGLGTVSITALTGDISQTGAITQHLGAGQASFTAVAGATINLGTQANTFAAPVKFLGTAVTSVQLRDTNTLAALPDLTDVIDTLGDLGLTFNNAPAVLPSYTALANLAVTADGIYQQPGTHLAISGTADFNSTTFKLDLSNSDNDFNALRLRSSGREDVHVVDVDDIAFGAGNSDVGAGRLIVKAGGAITQTANRIKQAAGAGPASFTAPTITLTRTANDFTGEVLLNATGNATVVDANSIVFGKVTVGGNFSATATNNITQLAGSTITVTGSTALDSGPGANVITLDNAGNIFTGAVQLSDGTVTLRSTTALTFSGASVEALHVTAGGAITQQAGSSLVIAGAASFDAGTALIDLSSATNDFQDAVAATSTAAVTLGDVNAIQLGDVHLGSGAFSVNATGNITQAANTTITQRTGGGALSFLGGAANSVTLNQPGNHFTGTVAVDANNVNLLTTGDLTFSGTSDIDGNLTIVAGGTLRLPTVAANLNDLGTVNLSAAKTVVSTSLATDSGSAFVIHGAVELASGITINTSLNNSFVTFDGDVNPLGSLTFNVGNSAVNFVNGTWNQGANNLTITTTGQAAFIVGGVAAAPTTFAMSGGTLTLNVAAGGPAAEFFSGSTFRVGSVAGTAEMVTINTGAVATTVQFDVNSALQVGFGATNDRLVVTGAGSVSLNSSVRLIGSGVAGAVPSAVLDLPGTGILSGTFHDSLAPDGTPQDFFAGSDVVKASYLPTSALVGSGTVSSAASFTGFLPDGDKYTVTHSAGAAAGLVVIQNSRGQIDVAVRNEAAAGTLNIVTTKFSGDGLTEIGGIGVTGPGAITVNAGTSNLRGDLRVEGPLTALTIRDVLNETAAPQQVIHAGGPASASTSITGHRFDGIRIELGSALTLLKVAQFDSSHGATEPSKIVAERFGTITATGDAVNALVGNFQARLTNTNSLNSPMALASFTSVKLSDAWDLSGSVGTVTVSQNATSWVLGVSGNGALHPHGVTSTGALSINTENNSAIDVTGAIASFKSTNVFNLDITAGSLGSFTTVADPSGHANGNVNGLTLTLTGNQAGMALKSLAIAASLQNSTLHFFDGNVGTFTVGREVSNSLLTADATTAGGRFNTITVGRWNDSDLDAKSVGSLKSIGHAVAGLFGDIVDSYFTIRDQMGGLGIGTLAASGVIDTASFIVRAGGLTSFTATRGIVDSSITVLDAALGKVGTVTAASWQNTDLTARTIGTLKVTGAALVLPGSPLIVGNLDDSALLAFADSGTVPAIGTLSVAGGMNTDTVIAHNGITSLTVARALSNSTVVADNVLAGQLAVGRIGTLALGLAVSDQIVATTLGKVSTSGFVVQDGASPSFFVGIWSGGTLLANGASLSGAKSGIDSLTVAGALQSSATVTARSGIGSLTVRGQIAASFLTFDNPLDLPASGKVAKVSAGKWVDSTIRANVLTTLQTVPSAIDTAFGDFSNGSIAFPAVTVAGSSGAATDPVALTTFSVAEDLSDTAFNIPGGVKTFKVAGTVSDSDLAAGFATNARIASVTAAAWENTDLTTRVLSAMNVTGNTPRAIAGNISDSLLTIMGNSAGVGLGTLLAQGTVSNSTFQVTDGNVTSFTVGKFLDSNLLVGFRANSSVDLSAGGIFAPTDHTIGLFKTTQAFDATDPDSVSFHNSTIVATDLGTITLTGVDPAADRGVLFGVGFELGGTAGTVRLDVGAGLVPSIAPFTSGAFTYRGL